MSFIRLVAQYTWCFTVAIYIDLSGAYTLLTACSRLWPDVSFLASPAHLTSSLYMFPVVLNKAALLLCRSAWLGLTCLDLEIVCNSLLSLHHSYHSGLRCIQHQAEDVTWAFPVLCLLVLAMSLPWRGADAAFSPVNGCVISVDKLGCEDRGMLVASLDGSMTIPLLTWIVD